MDTPPAQTFEFLKKLNRKELVCIAEKLSLPLRFEGHVDMSHKLAEMFKTTSWSVCVSGASGDAPGTGGDGKGDGKGDGDDNEHPTGSDNEDPTGSEGGDMQIFVKKPDSKVITLNVEPDFTIADLKTAIKVKLNIPRAAQDLVFKDQYLEDAYTLTDYNIKNESTLELHHGLSGGAVKKGIQKTKVSKVEKTTMLKLRAEATVLQVPSTPIPQDLLQQADAAHKTLMNDTTGTLLKTAIETMNMEQAEPLLEFLSEYKLTDQNHHRIAPFFLPPLMTMKKAMEVMAKIGESLETAFAFQMGVCCYDDEAGKFNHTLVGTAVEARVNELRILQKHGIQC
jgi:hypothetical protein